MINSERVNSIFMDCLFLKEEIVDGKPIIDPIVVRGINMKYGLHPTRLENHKEEISNLVDELSDTFDEGASFLSMCEDKTGEQWSGFHDRMEQLLVLGIATGKMEYVFDKDFWKELPGGMPYVKRIKEGDSK
jgi:hypothetical protein